MATTVSVTRSREFTYIGCGAFGKRVIELMAELAGASGTRTTEEAGAALATDAGLVVVALWRPDLDLCEQADSAAYRIGRAWLPIVMEHPVIYVGPLVRPPYGPCFTCMWRRRVQHDVHHAATSAVHTAYAADQDRGPVGYLPQHARMAAGIAHRMLRQPGAPDSGGSGVSSDVSVLMLPGSGIMTRPVIRCGDCCRCRGAEQAEPSAITGISLVGQPR